MILFAAHIRRLRLRVGPVDLAPIAQIAGTIHRYPQCGDSCRNHEVLSGEAPTTSRQHAGLTAAGRLH